MFGIEFVAERDFIEHTLRETSHFWQYNEQGLVSIEKSVAMEAIQGPISMAEYMAGDYSRLYRFAVMHKGNSHACVIIVLQERSGENYSFRHMFRPAFGFGPWWGFKIGGGGWSF